MICIGAIVAIQDVDQHSYFTVEDGENKYTLSGAIHYSLVGERALFRVSKSDRFAFPSNIWALKTDILICHLYFCICSSCLDTDCKSWLLYRSYEVSGPCSIESLGN